MKFKSAAWQTGILFVLTQVGQAVQLSRVVAVAIERFADTGEERNRIELAAHDIVRAFVQDCDSPVADERDPLRRIRLFDLGTKLLGIANVVLCVNVDQDKVESTLTRLLDGAVMRLTRFDTISSATKYSVSYRTQHVARAHVENGAFRLARSIG